MDELTFLFLVFVVGVVVGWLWHAKLVFRKIAEDPDRMIRMLQAVKTINLDNSDDEPFELKVERHDNAIYLFRNDTNEFLAQGTTLQEALDLVNKRFPDMNFKGHLSKEQADELGIKI
jgi:hypothetical protein